MPTRIAPASNFMRPPPLAAPVVTFDKGARVPRLEPGTVIDGRQAGILFAQLATEGPHAELIEWDRERDPKATTRLDAQLTKKGPNDKGVLLLALSMDLLRAFRYTDPARGYDVILRGDRPNGYRVEPVPGA